LFTALLTALRLFSTGRSRDAAKTEQQHDKSERGSHGELPLGLAHDHEKSLLAAGKTSKKTSPNWITTILLTFLSGGKPVALAATERRQCRRLIQAHEGVVDSKSLTGPLIAFQAKCPPAMYRASNPALRKVATVWHPT
jgi:hypothetical protein